MVIKENVIRYFDRLAPVWDAGLVRNDEVISLILDNAQVTAGKDVLDVACGTGVLIPDYLQRKVSSVTGVDISPGMAEIARSKFPQPEVSVICGDAMEIQPGRTFGCIVIYNALPHFQDPERLISHLTTLLEPGGTLTAAHGMCREKINSRHQGIEEYVSSGLMPTDELAKIFGKFLKVTTVISDERMYQVAGRKSAM